MIKLKSACEKSALEMFIQDTMNDLYNGEIVLVFYDYQLEKLKEIFKDKLEYRYNKKEKWWICNLCQENY